MNGVHPISQRLRADADKLWQQRSLHQAWVSVLGFAVIALGAVTVSYLLDEVALRASTPNVRSQLQVFRLGYGALALVVIVCVAALRRRFSLAGLQRLLALVALPSFPMIWMAQVEILRSGENRGILGAGFHVAILAFAVLRAGRSELTLALFGGAVIEAVVFWSYFSAFGQPGLVPAGEPLITLVFALIGGIAVWTQHESERYTRKSIVVELQAKAASHLARVLFGVRDRANSPMQTLEVGFSLLERDGPRPAILDPMKRSFERLREIHEYLRLIQQGTSARDWVGAEMVERGDDPSAPLQAP